jgi:hypothetical protein
MKEKTVRQNMRVPESLNKSIEELAKEDHNNNWSNAAIRLLKAGLEAIRKPKK